MLLTLEERRASIDKMTRVQLSEHLDKVRKDIKEIEDLDDEKFSLRSEEYSLLIEEEAIVKAKSEAAEKAFQLRSQRTAAATKGVNPTTGLSGEPKIGNIKDNWQDDPKLGFANLQAMLAATRQVFVTMPSPVDMDPRMKFLLAAGSDAFATYSDPHGGFFVPESLLPGYLTTPAEADQFGAMVRHFQMATPVVKARARVDKDHRDSVTGGLLVTRRIESNPFRDSRFKTEELKFEASMLAAYGIVTEEQIEDGDTSIISLMSQYFPEEFASRVAYERIYGTGVGGEFEGILNCPGLITIAKESGQTDETINAENVIKMRSRCWNYQDAVWIVNPECFTQLIKLHLAVEDTGIYSLYHQSLTNDAPDRLLGRPIYYSEYASGIGTVGDIMLVNWKEYWQGNYKPLQSASSVHVRFDSHERVFKFWMRNAGRSPWRSTLQIKKSKNNFTMSPFVVLAARVAA